MAYPTLQYRRRQDRQLGPIHIYSVELDVPGYERRLVTVEFVGRYWWRPEVYADGPADYDASPHRFPRRGRRQLCLWYSGDPRERRWEPEDGLLVLFGMVAEHLFKEAWWREHGEWLGEEYPHDDLKDEDFMAGDTRE